MRFLYQKEYDKNVKALSSRPLNEIAAVLSAAVGQLVNHFDEMFTRWTLIAAPIQVVNPDPAASGIKTMCAGDDGKIYINPAFWNTAYAYSRSRNSEINTPQDMGFLLFHEICHQLFQHPHYHPFIVNDAHNRKIPVDIAREIANTCMDYIINALCAELFPRAVIFRYPEEGFHAISKLNFLSTLDGLGVKTRLIAQRVLSKAAYEWEWSELYTMAVATWHKSGVTNRPESPLNLETERDRLIPEDQEVWEEHRQKILIRGVHGETIDASQTLEARAGSLPERDSPVETWPRICIGLLPDLRRHSGNQSSAEIRILEQISETKIPWTQAMHNLVHHAVRADQVTSSWRTPARKNPHYPGRTYMETGNIWFLIDTSASISDHELSNLMGTAVFASRMKVEHQGRVIIIPWDVVTYDDFVLEKYSDTYKLQAVPGGGGTLLKPALQKLLSDVRFGCSDLVIICTDSCIHDSGDIFPYLKAIYNKAGNKILWFNIGREEDAAYLHDCIYVLRINREDYQYIL